MSAMKETETDSVFTPEVMAELQKRADDAAGGIRDPERMRQAAERMDRMSVRENVPASEGRSRDGLPQRTPRAQRKRENSRNIGCTPLYKGMEVAGRRAAQ